MHLVSLIKAGVWAALLASGPALAQTTGSGAIGDSPRAAETIRRPSGPRVVALLTGCRIVVMDATSGLVLAERALGDSALWSSGLALGTSQSGDRVFATLTHRRSHATAIVRFDLADYSVHQIAVLPDSVTYPWLVVGPITGQLFVAADSVLRIAVVDPANIARVVRYLSGRDPTIDWGVSWFTIAPDESRLFASYHGFGAGVDWIDVRGTQLTVCTRSNTQPPRTGCGSSHGRVESYRDGFVAATGGGLVVVDAKGIETDSFGTGLSSRNHFMEFALDTVDGQAYIIGPCVMAGGLSRVGLSSPGAIQALSGICGERVVLSDDRRLLAIASGTTISILDAGTGALLRQAPVTGTVLDLSFVGR